MPDDAPVTRAVPFELVVIVPFRLLLAPGPAPTSIPRTIGDWRKCHIYHLLGRGAEVVVQHIGFVVFPNFQVMSLAVITVFEVANLVIEEAVYGVSLVSEPGGLVRSSAGFCVDTEAFGARSFDTVIIGAGTKVEPMT